MTLQEMILSIREGTQQIGAARNRGYEDDEILFTLNKMQDHFIYNQCRQKEDGTWEIVHYNKIAPLILADYQARCYRTDATYAIMPGNLLYLTGRAAVLSCDGTFQISTLSFTELVFVKTTIIAAPYYAIRVYINGSQALAIPARYPVGGSIEFAEVIDIMIRELENKGYEIYHGKMGNAPAIAAPIFDEYRRIYVRNPDNITQASAFVDDVPQTTNYFNLGAVSAGGATKSIPIEIVNTILTHEYISTPYYKPSTLKCVGNLVGRELKIFGPEGSIVVGALLSYVRKPQRMSIILSRGCELPTSEHPRICDMAVEYLTAATDPDKLRAIMATNDRRS